MGGTQASVGERTLRTATELERPLWGVVIVATVADVWLTWAGLQLGLHELNPVARTVVGTGGVAGLLALKALCIVVCASLRPALPEGREGLIPLGLSIPWVTAAAVNAALVLAVLLRRAPT